MGYDNAEDPKTLGEGQECTPLCLEENERTRIDKLRCVKNGAKMMLCPTRNECEVATCVSITLSGGASFVETITEARLGSAYDVACPSGMMFEGDAVHDVRFENDIFVGKVKCLGSGLYDPPAVKCVDLPVCDATARCKGDVSELKLGQTCPAKCKDTEEPSIETLRCELQEDMKTVALDPASHDCVAARCVAPDETTRNAGHYVLPVEIEFVEKGESVTVECEDGFESEERDLVCNADTLTLNKITCKEFPTCDVECDDGRTTLDLDETCDITPEESGNICTAVEVKCTRDGISPATQECTCAACPLPKVIQASVDTCGESIGKGDTSCLAQCLPGHALSLKTIEAYAKRQVSEGELQKKYNYISLECSDACTLNVDRVECIPELDCEDLSRCVETGPLHIGEHCEANDCENGQVVGASSKFLTCERRGDKAVLIPETTECDEVVCDPIEMSKHHQHHPYTSEKCPGGSVRDRPECELTCNLGYVFGNGSMTQTVRCDDSGSWESIPTCSPVACPKMQGIIGT